MEDNEKRVHLHRGFALHICVLNFTCSLVAILGNVLVIRALQIASSMPTTELPYDVCFQAFLSDDAVGLFAQPITIWCHHIAVMLNMAASGNFESLCRLFCLYLSLPISQFFSI